MDATSVARIVLRVNGDDAQKAIDNLKKRLDLATKAKNDLDKKYAAGGDWDKKDVQAYRRLSREIATCNRQLDATQATSEKVERALKNLSGAGIVELRQSLKAMERAQRGVTRGTKDWEELAEAISKTKRELAEIQKEGDAAISLSDRFSKFGGKWVGIVTTLSMGLEALTGVKAVMGNAVQDFAEMEEHMAGVRKYTGLNEQAVKELNEAFKQMDTRTSREQLNDLAADAGRLGITGKRQVLDFVDAANQINVALGEDLGEDAVKNIGKLAQLFGDADSMGLKQAMLSTASTINELAQTSSADEGYIMDFTARLSGLARQAGMTQAQVMGLASVMDQAMVNSEEGSTALSKIIQKLYREPAEMARAMGLDVKQFTELMKRDANAALLQWAGAAKQLGGMDKLAPILGELDVTGAGVSKTVTALANNLELVKSTQEQATEAFREGTSATREYNVANNTVQAGLEKAQEGFRNVSIELGERLKPISTQMLGVTSVFIRSLNILIGFIATHIGLLAKLCALGVTYYSVVALQVAWTKRKMAADFAAMAVEKAHMVLIRAQLALSALWTAATYLLTGNFKAATAAIRTFGRAMAANPWGLLLTVVTAAAMAVYAFATRTKELTAAQIANQRATKDINEAWHEANRSTIEQKNRIQLLSAIIRDNSRSIDERKDAIRRLQKIIPNYNQSISAEGKLMRDNEKAITDYIKKLDDLALAKAIHAKLIKAAEEQVSIDMAVDAWERGIRNRQSIMNSEGHESRKVTRAIPYSTTKTTIEYETNEIRIQDEEIQARNRQKLDYYKKRQDENLRYQNSLKNYAKRKGITNLLEDVATGKSGGVTTVEDIPTGGGGGSAGSAGASGSAASDADNTPSAADTIAERAKQARIWAEMEYEAGLTNYREYEDKLLDIREQAATQQRDTYEAGTAEWNKHELDRLKVQRETAEKVTQWTLEDIDAANAAEVAKEKKAYAFGERSEEQHQAEMSRIRLKGLKERADYLAAVSAGSPEALKAQAEYEEEEMEQQVSRRKQLMKELNEIVKRYETDKQEATLQSELDAATRLADQLKLKEEDKQKMLQAIRDGWKEKNPDSWNNEMGAPSDAFSSSLIGLMNGLAKLRERLKEGKTDWTDYATVAVQALGMVSATMQSASQLMQANLDAETAKVTNRYDREIEAAGENTTRGRKLEEKKQKELDRIRAKYAKKQLSANISTALAQTAQNAILAYGSVLQPGVPWTYPLAAIAAAAAVASGMMQVAVMKKQAEAQAEGYYDGGFTGGRSYRREAGVVHEGEFVANRLAVQNPNVLPVLRLIDHAQRTNTVSSLTAADLSRAAGSAPAALSGQPSAGQAPIVVTTPDPDTARTLQRLADRLDEGIDATVSIEQLDRTQRRYNKLKNR